MPGRGRNDDAHPFLGQDNIDRPSVDFGLDPFGETALTQSPQMVRQTTTLPADDRGQVGDLQLAVRRDAQCAEHVIVSQRESTVLLKLALIS